jgi:hypothetical protein
MIAVWFVVIRFLPRMLLSVYKKAILVKGFGDGPIPVNTLYMQPESIFENPLQASGSKSVDHRRQSRYADHHRLVDLRNGPQRLHVPDMDGRYYSVQFTASDKKYGVCIRRQTNHGNAGRRLSDHRSRLERRAGRRALSRLFCRERRSSSSRVLVYGESDLSPRMRWQSRSGYRHWHNKAFSFSR